LCGQVRFHLAQWIEENYIPGVKLNPEDVGSQAGGRLACNLPVPVSTGRQACNIPVSTRCQACVVYQFLQDGRPVIYPFPLDVRHVIYPFS
jgi:hypothetical protein